MTSLVDSQYNRDACLRLMIGSASVTVRSELHGLLDEVAELYPVAPESAFHGRTIQIAVRKTRRRRLGTRYQVYADGMKIGGARRRNEVFPFVEWGINRRIIETQSQFVQLHAASMAHHGNGFIFAGASGNGKSTLAAGLLARGWEYCSDEFALVDRATLCLEPFPKPLCIKAGSFRAIEQTKLRLSRFHYIKSQKGRVGYIGQQEVAAHVAPRRAPVRYVIFPKYVEGQQPTLREMSPARALMDLAGCVFNRHVFHDQGLSILANVIEGAECYRLDVGNLSETCDVLEAHLKEVAASSPVKSFKKEVTVSGYSKTSSLFLGQPLGRRTMLKCSATLAYALPTVLTLTAQQAFAGASNPSGVCSTGLATNELCVTDSDCCSGVCDIGVCQ